MRKSLWTAGLALLITLAGSAAEAQTWKNPDSWKSVRPQEFKNIVYGNESGQQQLLDVYIPQASKPTPVLVYFHGGAWWKGERPQTWGGYRGFLAAGMAVVSVDYRLTGVSTAPAAVQDARCALAWVKANAAKYNFDPNRVIPYGTSAGGHLAMMSGFLPANSDVDLPACKDQPKVAAILDFYGPYDLTLAPTTPGAWRSSSIAKWMGDVKDQKSMLAKMSPKTYVKAGVPPVAIVHGDADPTVPYQQSLFLNADLEKAKVPHAFYTVKGGLHGQFSPEEKINTILFSLEFLQSQHIIQ